MYNYLSDVCSNEELFINFSISLSTKYVLDILTLFIIMSENKKKHMSMRVFIQIEHPLCKVACMHRLYLIVL